MASEPIMIKKNTPLCQIKEMKPVQENMKEKRVKTTKKVKKESFESGVLKARRYHRVGKLMSFKDFMKIMSDILGEWEK